MIATREGGRVVGGGVGKGGRREKNETKTNKTARPECLAAWISDVLRTSGVRIQGVKMSLDTVFKSSLLQSEATSPPTVVSWRRSTSLV